MGGVQTCILGGNCLTESLVYKGEVKYQINNPRTGAVEDKTKYYVGLTCNSFKLRHDGHKTSINNPDYRNKGTTLSSHIWKLKDNNINFDLKFSILKLSRIYTKEAKYCDLCLTEKTFIMFHNHFLSSEHTDHYSSLRNTTEMQA